MEQKIQEFLDRLRKAKSIVIMGHKNPDGDSLCSVLALAHLIEENFGISPVCVYDGNIPENYKQRLSYELQIINDMGFPNYFLVVFLVVVDLAVVFFAGSFFSSTSTTSSTSSTDSTSSSVSSRIFKSSFKLFPGIINE